MFEREGTFVLVLVVVVPKIKPIVTHSPKPPSYSLGGTGLLAGLMPSMVRKWEGGRAGQDKTTKTADIVYSSLALSPDTIYTEGVP